MTQNSFAIFFGILSAIITYISIIFIYFYNKSPRKIIQQRLDQLRNSNIKAHQFSQKSSLIRVNKNLEEIFNFSSSFATWLKQLTYRAGFSEKLRYLIQLCGFMFFILYSLLLSLLESQPLLVIFSGAFFGTLIIVYTFLSLQQRTWIKKFRHLFPDSLDIITRALKAGLPITGGLNTAAEEIPDPVGYEFRHITAQLAIGVSLEQALLEAANRIGMDDFRLFAIALTIQKETGGSLSTILSKLAEMVREREKFRKKVLTLTAEARTSALIIGTLPFVIIIVLHFINPDYLSFFFVDPLGKQLIWVVVILSILSLIITKKMVKFNV